VIVYFQDATSVERHAVYQRRIHTTHHRLVSYSIHTRNLCVSWLWWRIVSKFPPT